MQNELPETTQDNYFTIDDIENQDSAIDTSDAAITALESFTEMLSKERLSKLSARVMTQMLDQIRTVHNLEAPAKVSLEEFPPLTTEGQQQETIRNFKDTEPLVETINCYVVQLRQNKLKQIGIALSRLTPFVERLQILIGGVVSESKATCGLLENVNLVLDKPTTDTVKVNVTSLKDSLPPVSAITQDMAFHISRLIERLSIVETTLESVFTKIPVHDLQERLEKTNFGYNERWHGTENVLDFPVTDLETVKANLEHFEKFTSYLQLDYLKETIDRIGSAINTMLENAVEPEFATLMDVINNLTGIRFLSVPLMSVHNALEFLESHLKVQTAIANQWLRKDVGNESHVLKDATALQSTYLNSEWMAERTFKSGTVQVSAFPNLANNYTRLEQLVSTQLEEDKEQLEAHYTPAAREIIKTIYTLLGNGPMQAETLRTLAVPSFKPFPFPVLTVTGVPQELSVVELPALTPAEAANVSNVIIKLRASYGNYLSGGLGQTWTQELMDSTPVGLVSKFSLEPRVDGSLSTVASKLPELTKNGLDQLLIQRQFALINRYIETGYQYFISNRKDYIETQLNLVVALENWLEASIT